VLVERARRARCGQTRSSLGSEDVEACRRRAVAATAAELDGDGEDRVGELGWGDDRLGGA